MDKNKKNVKKAQEVKEFIFEQKDKHNGEIWDDRVIELKHHVYNLIEDCTQDFSVVIDKYSPKQSEVQLRGYWRLITVCKNYMNEQGNNYTKEEVSNYFKIKAGHYNDIEGNKTPKSIKRRSDTTKQEMSNLMRCIVAFGVEFEIQDCFLEPTVLKEMLSYYKGN